MGFLVGCLNTLVWTTYFSKISAWLRLAHLSTPMRRSVKIVNLVVILPIGIFLCVSPLFSPFAALPLAQQVSAVYEHCIRNCMLTRTSQWQWLHHCDSFPGEAILAGRSYANETSTITFYYATLGTSVKNPYFGYSMSRQGSYSVNWTLELDGPSQVAVPAELLPLVRSVSYDPEKSTMSATCLAANDSSTNASECMLGHFVRDNLSISLNDTRVNTEIQVRPVDKEWLYSNDAPSFTLHYVKPNGQLGDMIMETAVTQRNHCEILKICLQASTPTLEVIAPLGLALWAEDRYATYCYSPKAV